MLSWSGRAGGIWAAYSSGYKQATRWERRGVGDLPWEEVPSGERKIPSMPLSGMRPASQAGGSSDRAFKMLVRSGPLRRWVEQTERTTAGVRVLGSTWGLTHPVSNRQGRTAPERPGQPRTKPACQGQMGHGVPGEGSTLGERRLVGCVAGVVTAEWVRSAARGDGELATVRV